MAKSDAAAGLFPAPAAQEKSEPVECLGMTFASDEERREHFLQRLKEKLPELRQRPDFPTGNDEDILRLSDPPYYTACPNPFLAEFVAHYGKPYDPEEPYRREPFAVDVSEGKTDPLYKAHGYHTKVPHRAIVPSILHYTEPGDIVLDGFCGSGMTGVAAQWCGAAPAAYRQKIERRRQEEGRKAPQWGARRAILGDLSPAATFIAANYNIPFDAATFAEAARKLLDDVENEIGWMYETLHADGKTKGRIDYTVWSEVFSCPECAGEVVFIEEALDRASGGTRDEFPCPECRATLAKRRLNRLYVSEYDAGIGKTVRTTKRVPVFIVYTVEGTRYRKNLDAGDREALRRIAALDRPPELPLDRMMHTPEDTNNWGDEYSPGVAGFSHVRHLFLPRAAHALAAMWRRAQACPDSRTKNVLLFFVEQAIWNLAFLNRFRPTGYSQVNQYMAGRIRVLSQHAECSPHYILNGKLKRLAKAFAPPPAQDTMAAVTIGDCARIAAPDNSIDYVFTDPPFGHNLAYGELNFINEAFLRVFTKLAPEAIVSRTQRKDLGAYQRLMQRCFENYYRVLKPGRWMTIVFHNSKNAVWNAIQEALLSVGFVVADVRILDKKSGTFNQVNAGGAVKQDLVISAYKPNDGLEERFKLTAGTEAGVWDFVRTHLRQLPAFVAKEGKAEVIAERRNYLLFDRMVAFHVQRGVMVPLSAAEFYEGLAQRFSERDGMFFLTEQVAEYDRKRMKAKEVLQLEIFVKDEETALQWLKQSLAKKPQTFQEIHPQFIKEIGGWQKHEKTLELALLLEQNFLCYDGAGEVPGRVHSYLSTNFKELRKLSKDDAALRTKAKNRWYAPDPSKAADLERLRERALLREFEEYRKSEKRRLRVFRLEAVRAGFRQAWRESDYATIIAVARKIPETILQEDPKLLMWYDQAITRMENKL